MDQPSLISVIAGAAGAMMAAFERYRSIQAVEREKTALVDAATSKQQSTVHADIIKGKDELISVARETADAQRTRWEAEHKEFQDYRESTHSNLNKANELVLKLTEENGQLKAKTDMTPIFQFQENQAEINKRIVDSLDSTQKSLTKVLDHLIQNEDNLHSPRRPGH